MAEAFSINVESNKVMLDLSPILDMSIAEEFLVKARECASHGKDIIIDGHSVERVSTPCLQIILALALKTEKNGHSFKLINPSMGLERGMRELGLAEYLGKWSKN